ncbi:MAG: hypothetical protein IJT97_11150 [Bacteroidaceae bacterium]|nr:hypothetical protein [Bacteroidaceae bacterium]
MIEELQIKCPSCGIFLEVRNSRHEAVKRIVCPNCKKQLAVDFREDEKPKPVPRPLGTLYYGNMPIALQEGVNHVSLPGFDNVEIKVVRLADGNSKCMVRPLGESIAVKVNDQTLQEEDQVVLTVGDRLQVGNSVLVYDKPSDDYTPPTPPPPQPTSFRWVYTVAALVVTIVMVAVLWPSKKQESEPPVAAIINPPPTPPEGKKIEEKPKPKAKITADKPVPPTTYPVTEKPTFNQFSDYELEQKASKGSVDARLELGKRLIKRNGVNNIVRGINYLQLASRNGSSEAKALLTKAVNALQQKADNGDSTAYYVLQTIDKQ